MRFIKGFYQYINESNYSYSIQERREILPGSPNWFTRDEINYIKGWGNDRGVKITESKMDPNCD